MGLKSVMAYLKSMDSAPFAPADTPLIPRDTPEKPMGYQEKSLQINADTPDTPDTPKNINSRENFPACPLSGVLKPASPKQSSSERRNPNDWRELATAYHLHHAKCHICIAASKGAMYGLRCGAGAALWVAYQDAP